MSERYYIKIGTLKLNAGRLQRFSKRIRAERGEICERCGEKANQVHHVLEKYIFPALAFEPDNVLVLCSQCHGLATMCQKNLPDWSHDFFAKLPSRVQKRIRSFRVLHN
jgi:hypothetical protein